MVRGLSGRRLGVEGWLGGTGTDSGADTGVLDSFRRFSRGFSCPCSVGNQLW